MPCLEAHPDFYLIPRCDPKCRSDPDHTISSQSEGVSLDQNSRELRALGGRGGVPYIRTRENWSWRTGTFKRKEKKHWGKELSDLTCCVCFKPVCVFCVGHMVHTGSGSGGSSVRSCWSVERLGNFLRLLWQWREGWFCFFNHLVKCFVKWRILMNLTSIRIHLNR